VTELAVPVLRLGTRRSALALAQSRAVAERIEKVAADAGRPVRVELVELVTRGDTSSAPLASFGGVGVFVSRLRQALLAREVDLAVHSLKDLPTTPEPGLVVAAVPVREDPRDVLVARDGLTLGELPAGSRIGTGSPRRAAQLRALGLGLEIVDLRGNVDTRLATVAGGRLDAVVLARAGLVRLGRADEATEVLDPLLMLPAPGQGALAVECRVPAARVPDGSFEDGVDRAVLAAVRPLDDPASRVAVTAERRLLAALEAGCAAPLGALAEVVDGEDGPELSVRAVVAAVDGSVALRRSLTGPVDDPEALGDALAAVLAEDGAAELVPPRLPTSIDPAEPHTAAPPDPSRPGEPRTASTTREGDQ
jgi:hydroxymethylbilane synthase